MINKNNIILPRNHESILTKNKNRKSLSYSSGGLSKCWQRPLSIAEKFLKGHLEFILWQRATSTSFETLTCEPARKLTTSKLDEPNPTKAMTELQNIRLETHV